MKKGCLVLICVLAVSLILVGCAQTGKSKKAMAGKAIFVQDWDKCPEGSACDKQYKLCKGSLNKNCDAKTGDAKRLCQDNCLEFARGYNNAITKCPGNGYASMFSGKHNFKLVGQFQMKCNTGLSQKKISSKGTTNFQFDCGNDPLTGLQGNYNSNLEMHQIKGFCGGNKGVNDRPREPEGKIFFDCGTKGISAVDFKIDPQGFVNDINKVYCEGETVPAKSPSSWGVMKTKSCTFKAKQTCFTGEINNVSYLIDTTLTDCKTTSDTKKSCGDVCVQYIKDTVWCGPKSLEPAKGNADELWRWDGKQKIMPKVVLY